MRLDKSLVMPSQPTEKEMANTSRMSQFYKNIVMLIKDINSNCYYDILILKLMQTLMLIPVIVQQSIMFHLQIRAILLMQI